MIPRISIEKPSESAPASNAFLEKNAKVLCGGILLVLVTFLAYIPAFRGGFVLDDDVLLSRNNQFQTADGLYDIWFTTKCLDYWPVTNTTFWIERQLWGKDNSSGYHAVNIILHVVEALLLWLILHKLKLPGAYLAAFLFAVHPVNVESVAWIASRKNLVAMLFMELSVLAYLRLELPKEEPLKVGEFSRWYILSFLAFVLAMLGKGSAAPFPFLLLLTVYWLRPLRRGDFLKTIPFFVAAAILSVVNVWFQTHGEGIVVRDAGLAERAITVGYAVWFYLYKAFLPFNLALIYPTVSIDVNNVLWYLPFAAVIVVSLTLFVLQIRGVKRIRPFFFAWTFFVISLAPVLGFANIGFFRYALVANRYQHISLIAVGALVAAGWTIVRNWFASPTRFAPDAIAAIAVLGCAALSFQQCEPYKDSVAWYSAAITANPNCWMAYNNLANDIASARPDEAISHYIKTLEIKPDYDGARQNLGVLYMQTNQLQKAIDELSEAVRRQPKNAYACLNLANAYKADKQYSDSIRWYERGLKLLDKPAPDSILSLSEVYYASGDFAAAVKECEKVLELDPYSVNALVGLGTVLNKQGKYAAAAENLEKAADLRPNSLQILSSLATAYAGAGKKQDAIRTAETALQIARESHDASLIAQIKAWLDDYRTGLSKGQNVPDRDFFTPLR